MLNLAAHVADILEHTYGLRPRRDKLVGNCPWRDTSNSGAFVFYSGQHDPDWWNTTWWKDFVTGESGNVYEAASRLGISWRSDQLTVPTPPPPTPQRAQRGRHAGPRPEDIPHYRQLYAVVAAWASAWLHDPVNPAPRHALLRRGCSPDDLVAQQIGYALDDPASLVTHLRATCPELLPYAEAAGVLVRRHGELVTHRNLQGRIVLPYLAEVDGVLQVVDLRTRSLDATDSTPKYLSLAGGTTERGAVFPYLWQALQHAHTATQPPDTVLITEGEFKALAVTAAYARGELPFPAVASPGLTTWRADWATLLQQAGITTVILAYDSQPRRLNPQDGLPQLTPEEAQTVRLGETLVAAGLRVRVLRLPLNGAPKADLDDFLHTTGAAALEPLLRQAPDFGTYHLSLERDLLQRAGVPLPLPYPTRPARPRRIPTPAPSDGPDAAAPPNVADTWEAVPADTPQEPGGSFRFDMQTGTVYRRIAAPPTRDTLSLDTARATIPQHVTDHALNGHGMLVLAHPPGTGKGYGTEQGLKAALRSQEDAAQLVWSAARKDQRHDLTGTLDLTLLEGRNRHNCVRMDQVDALVARGYNVQQSLCKRQCPLVGHCDYHQQFHQDADIFAAQPMLLATRWWEEAGVLVLDEFNPAHLTRVVSLTPADMTRMYHAARCPHLRQLLNWLAQALATTIDRTLRGPTLLAHLEELARRSGQELATTLRHALAALPPESEDMIADLPPQAEPMHYDALPPAYAPVIVRQLARDHARWQQPHPWMSRVEARDGHLTLHLRHDTLIAQLTRDQPTIILDATVNAALLRTIFPTLPFRIEHPQIALRNRVRQIIGRNWAKTSLTTPERTAQWYAEVAAHVRPERPTLVVCTRAEEDGLRDALTTTYGLTNVTVAHYGGLRGSNAYRGYDVLLAQIYQPNMQALRNTGRALFADDPQPLDERLITVERTLTDASGSAWQVQVVTCADPRLAALLDQAREAEMTQCALRGRPFDHPEAQITILSTLPLPHLPPTELQEATQSATSNAGRQQAVHDTLLTAARQLLHAGLGRSGIDVTTLATTAGVSVTTVRKHWEWLANQLHVRCGTRRRTRPMPRGGCRVDTVAVLLRRTRGRWVPPPTPAADHPAHDAAPDPDQEPANPAPERRRTCDQAGNTDLMTRVIPRYRASQWARAAGPTQVAPLLAAGSPAPDAGPALRVEQLGAAQWRGVLWQEQQVVAYTVSAASAREADTAAQVARWATTPMGCAALTYLLAGAPVRDAAAPCPRDADPDDDTLDGWLFAAVDVGDWALAEVLAAHHDDPTGVRLFLAQMQALEDDP
jgi:hypothetical protein